MHIGKFVAEAKWEADAPKYTELAAAQDTDGIMDLLTNNEVEARILDRVELKAITYGSEEWAARNTPDPPAPSYKVDPSLMRWVYEDFIIPLTKRVEVDYLYRRAEDDSGPECEIDFERMEPVDPDCVR